MYFWTHVIPHLEYNGKVFRLVADEWTPESGDLSPTLKLKRKVLMKKYKPLVEGIYEKKQ